LILLAILVAGTAAPWIAPYDPIEQTDTVAGRLLPPLSVRVAVQLEHGRWLLADQAERRPDGLHLLRLGESEIIPLDSVLNLTATGVAGRRVYLLGSDRLSRDILSRLLYGARVSLLVAFTVVLLSLTIGLLVGTTAAMAPAWIDSLLMRIVDGLMAFPSFFLLLALSAVLPSSIWTLVLVISGVGWMTLSRMIRAEILSLKNRDFVLAAVGLGATKKRIFFRHLLPNITTLLLVDLTLRISRVILVEAALSFLGLGIQPPEASWGNMIGDSRGAMFTSWWVGAFPCIALVLTVLPLNILSDRLTDTLQPGRR
jgi:peptide/nickel transport system permease protein